MAVHTDFAHLSDGLFTTAIAAYTVAMACYTAEYAFGRKGRIAETSATPERELVGAGVAAGGSPKSGSLGTVADEPGLDVAAAAPTDRTGQRLGRIAVAVTALGVLLHLSSVVLRGVSVDRVPWGNMYEFASVAGLVAVIAFLAIVWRMPQIRYMGGFALLPVIVVMFLAGTVWYVKAAPLVPALQSYWLAIHVSAAASSEGVLMTSSVLTVLYLVRIRHDAKVLEQEAAAVEAEGPASAAVATAAVTKLQRGLASRLPSAAALDKAAYRAAAFAFPIYTFGVIAGAIWAEAAWGRYWGWDPKEVWAFIVWVLFAAYLHARATAGWRGRAAAWINLLGFFAMTFNFFVVNVVIAGLHSYSGL